ncbi:acyl-CoA carboxylase subunit epsilon [Streptomyces populi]
MLHGNPSDEDLAALTVVLCAVTRHLTAAPVRPVVPRAGWEDTRRGRSWSTGSWRAASRGWGRGSRA